MKATSVTRKGIHDKSLVEELLPDNVAAGVKRKQSKKRRRLEERSEEGGLEPEAQLVAFQQRYEIADEERKSKKQPFVEGISSIGSALDSASSDEEEEEDMRSLGSRSVVGGEDYGLTEEEERCLQLFESENYLKKDESFSTEGPTLASLILQRMEEFEASKRGENQSLSHSSAVPPNVRELYCKVGDVLKHYHSGKLPKAVKMLPSVASWYQLLSYTRPSEWSTASVYVMTKLFIANLKSNEAQRFCSWILLPRVHEEIMKRKKLNFHFYQALKKALFKPEAFFKGIIFPLCESGECTAREATILGSILLKSSIPVLHSASCLLKLSSFLYSPAVVIFIRILLEKKYALPSKVIDSVYQFFLSKQSEKSQSMPVLWHHALLVFVRFYHETLTVEQRKQLRTLVTRQSHPGVTPEIKSILSASKERKIYVFL
ncbi:Bystin [Galdieria sulphuraria]|nr:Bystin [Galdieria sulphuraria]